MKLEQLLWERLPIRTLWQSVLPAPAWQPIRRAMIQTRETFAATTLPSGAIRVIAPDRVAPGAVPVSPRLAPWVLSEVCVEPGCEVRGLWAELLERWRATARHTDIEEVQHA